LLANVNVDGTELTGKRDRLGECFTGVSGVRSSSRQYERWGTSTPAVDPRRTLQIAIVAMAIGATSSAWAVLALGERLAGDRNTQTSLETKTYLNEQRPTWHVAEGRTIGGHTANSRASAAPSVTPTSTAVDTPSSGAPEVEVVPPAPREQDTKLDVPSSPAALDSQVDLSRDKQPAKEPAPIDMNNKVDIGKNNEKGKPSSIVDRKINPYRRWAIRRRYRSHWPF
jgi:hypothetical protein